MPHTNAEKEKVDELIEKIKELFAKEPDKTLKVLEEWIHKTDSDKESSIRYGGK